MLDVPLLEPGDFQEAKDMTRWLYDLSEELDCLVMLRMVAKISHTRGNVTLGELSTREKKAHFDLIPKAPPMKPTVPLVDLMSLHAFSLQKLDLAREKFESSPFNRYSGPDNPDLLVICCGASYLYSMETLRILELQERVGVLKLGNPIMANGVFVGALVGSGVLPLDRKAMAPVLLERFGKAVDINMKALDRGFELVK